LNFISMWGRYPRRNSVSTRKCNPNCLTDGWCD